ncbi:MAG: acetoin utilization protein AcuC [Dehalococcoidia bacterium]|nr:acetoin utilization protein AcuC [Dehalococcoidia bacterium]
MKTAFLYGEDLIRRDSRADEIFGPTRLEYTYELLKSYGAFKMPGSVLEPPREAGETDLVSFHTADYVAAVRKLSNGQEAGNPLRFNFSETGDNPVYPGMYELSTLVVGSSLHAAEMVAGGEASTAFNSSGGLHHAAPDHASGFCIFNDVAISIKFLVSRGLRIGYVDVDAHHADGVQNAFYDTDRVLTISLHGSGRYLFPGTGEVEEAGTGAGRGYSVNLPLAPYTDDAIYLWAFDRVVPPLINRFAPDILVTQLGCDTHYLDPLTQFRLTTRGYEEIVRKLKSLELRWVAFGGGGYEPSVVTRCWTLAYGIMMGVDWPDDIPADFREVYGLRTLRDGESRREGGTVERARRFAEEKVSAVRKLIFPLHGLEP